MALPLVGFGVIDGGNRLEGGEVGRVGHNTYAEAIVARRVIGVERHFESIDSGLELRQCKPSVGAGRCIEIHRFVVGTHRIRSGHIGIISG